LLGGVLQGGLVLNLRQNSEVELFDFKAASVDKFGFEARQKLVSKCKNYYAYSNAVHILMHIRWFSAGFETF